MESLASYAKVKSREITLREAALSRSEGPVKVGSYYRTVDQGRKNLRESVATVVVGLWLGLVKSEDLQKLFTLAGKGLGTLEGEGAERAAEVIQALIEKLVTV